MNVNTKFIFTSDKQQQQSRHWIGIVQGKANKVRTWRFASPPTLSNKEQFTRPLLYHLIVGPLQNSFWRSKKRRKWTKENLLHDRTNFVKGSLYTHFTFWELNLPLFLRRSPFHERAIPSRNWSKYLTYFARLVLL